MLPVHPGRILKRELKARRPWLNLRVAYELAKAERELGERVAAEVAPDAA